MTAAFAARKARATQKNLGIQRRFECIAEVSWTWLAQRIISNENQK
jgi:hypothetical protein